MVKHSTTDIERKLKDKNINLSFQRVKILEYLENNRSHPTVDQIYSALHEEIPTLSKTTIYNTLKKLIEEDLVRVITIEENETRYDIITEEHGHFKCESCKAIFDFSVDMNALSLKGLEHFKINNKNMYFEGICPGCIRMQGLESDTANHL
ncbi:MAG: Fur family transcriptional regulator [Acetivibrionales bacterium]|jgi:Fur family peroxide stress response transcriptional regulator|nr:transcriptional repressor [Clostridiaceae bacterium]